MLYVCMYIQWTHLLLIYIKCIHPLVLLCLPNTEVEFVSCANLASQPVYLSVTSVGRLSAIYKVQWIFVITDTFIMKFLFSRMLLKLISCHGQTMHETC